MNAEDREALREFLMGVVFALGAVAVMLTFLSLLNLWDKGPGESRFEVVDTYDGCDVVRYTDPSNRYHYLLRCDP